MALPIPFPVFRAFDHSTGAPLAFGLVNFYIAGTSTRQNTYTDATLGTPNANPVVLDINGEAQIFPDPNLVYKVVLTGPAAGGSVLQWTVDNWSVTSVAQSVSGHNILLNGGMEAWQMGISFVGANNLHLADGWAMNLNAAGAGLVTDYTISQVASGRSGSQFAMRVQRNAASTATRFPILVQNIETKDAIAMQGQYLTISFYARIGANYSGGAALACQVVGGTGTDESFQTALNFTGGFSVGTGNVTLTTSWQKFTVPISSIAPTNINEAAIVFTPGASSGTAGAADNYDIDDVQLEFGIVATPFEREPIDTLVRRCQRRLFKTFAFTLTPAQSAGLGTGAYRFQQAVGAAAATQTPSFPQPPWMRDSVSGVTTTYNPAAANVQIRNLTIAVDTTVTVTASEPTQQYATFTSAAGSAAGNTNAVHYVIDKRI